MAFGSGFEDDGEVMSEINMTPLVDVMLVLLIIFIIAMPLLRHSVQIDLPRVENQPLETKNEIINLSVTAAGEIHWNNEPVTSEELSLRLDAVASRQPQPEVHLQGDRTVQYEHVMKVMSAVQKAGMVKLGFVTDPGRY